MFLEILLAISIGILAGVFTGLLPGIHTNLVSVFLVSFSPLLLGYFTPISLAILIVAMTIANNYIDFIPAIYLGAPDEDTALSAQPGHSMLLKGQGHKAVLLSLLGSTLALPLVLIFTPILIFTLPKIYPFAERMMAWILIWICILLIAKEKFRTQALIIFILSGFLGIASLNSNISQPLLPLLTGLFGASALIQSISQKVQIPQQEISKLEIKKSELIKPSISAVLIAPFCSFLPGMGSSQAAIIGSSIFREISREQFLILVGSVNTIINSLAFVVLYTIGKSRTGSAVAVQNILQLSVENLVYITAIIMITAIISIFLAMVISKIFAKNIDKINYSKISIAILIFLTVVIFYFTGPIGFLIFAVSTILGITCSLLEVRKGFLMGSLLIPTILFYAPI